MAFKCIIKISSFCGWCPACGWCDINDIRFYSNIRFLFAGNPGQQNLSLFRIISKTEALTVLWSFWVRARTGSHHHVSGRCHESHWHKVTFLWILFSDNLKLNWLFRTVFALHGVLAVWRIVDMKVQLPWHNCFKKLLWHNCLKNSLVLI